LSQTFSISYGRKEKPFCSFPGNFKITWGKWQYVQLPCIAGAFYFLSLRLANSSYYQQWRSHNLKAAFGVGTAGKGEMVPSGGIVS
jgi:hypothetical protein